MVKDYNLFLESISNEEYIVAVPSGEVIFVSADMLQNLIDNDIVDWTRTMRDSYNKIIIVSCYTFSDKNKELITEYIEAVDSHNAIKDDIKNKDSMLKIAGEFQERMSNVFHGRQLNIGYMINAGIRYFYAIIPDLDINKKYYEQKKNRMDIVIKNIRMEHQNCVFTYVDRILDSRIKYFRNY